MNLTRAVSAIEKEFGWFELSHHVESEPWGYESDNKFLNVGMAFISDQTPSQVLHTLQRIEKNFSPSSHRNADGTYRDRLLDIDIMAADEIKDHDKYGKILCNAEIQTDELTLPHPHLQDRPFFLDPYRELKEIIIEKIQ